MNVAGRSGADILVPAIAGLLAAVAGAAYSELTIAGPTAVGALLVALLSVHFNFTDRSLPFELGGLLLLALGGLTGVTAYRSFNDARLAQQLGATFACDYLISADGRQYLPSPLGSGLAGCTRRR